MNNPTKTFVRWGMVAMLPAIGAPTTMANDILRELESAYISLAEKISPVVVRIETKGDRDAAQLEGEPNMDQLEEFFRRFGFDPPEGMVPRRRLPEAPQATGSGFIYDKQGHIVTNNHVVAEAGEITVELYNGRQYPATVIGKDPSSDIAVIKIEPDSDLPVAAMGTSSELKVGQFAIAMGSARGLRGSLSLSFGHVTALQREGLNLNLRFQNLIQTDAAINLGNSGGPLCNIDGEIIGINVAIVWGANSIGFAIPIDRAKSIVPTLIAEGKMAYGYLGVKIMDVEQVARQTGAGVQDFVQAAGLPDAKGAYVQSVIEGSPAAKGGLKVDDIVRKVNGETVDGAGSLTGTISNYSPGSTVTLEVWRDGNPTTLEVTLEEFPEDIEKVMLGEATLGMRVQDITDDVIKGLNLDPETKGVIVVDVESKSPADDAGIFQGDIIQKVAYEDVTDVKQFRDLVRKNAEAGKSLLLRIERPGEGSMPKVIKVPSDYKAE